MNDAGVAPPGVMPIQQPIRHARTCVIQYFGIIFQVFSTMRGSVYERRGEIFVYNAVGIAPSRRMAKKASKNSDELGNMNPTKSPSCSAGCGPVKRCARN